MLPRAGGYGTSPKHPPVDSLVLVAATGLASWAWLSRHKWPPLRTAVVLVVAFWAARAAMTGGAGALSVVSHLIWGTPDPRLVPLAAGIALVALVAAVWVLLRKRRRQAPSEGRRFDWRLWGKDLAWGLGMWGICELAWAAAFPHWSVLSLPRGAAAWASRAIFAFVISAPIEEWLYRRKLLTALLDSWGRSGLAPWRALVLQAVVFSVAHLGYIRPGVNFPDWPAPIPWLAMTAFNGLVWGVYAWRTGRLTAAILSHGLFNLL